MTWSRKYPKTTKKSTEKAVNKKWKDMTKEERIARIKKESIGWGIVVLAAVVIGLLLNYVIFMKAYIPSNSMQPTLNKGDSVIGFRLSYLFSDPERGDVVMFDYPDDESKTYVKRIIGLPGETIEITDGKVYIWEDWTGENKTLLDEPYLLEEPVGSYGVFQVPEDCYFVLGDNRNGSNDSRKWENKYVNRKKIRSKVLLRYWPNFGSID